MTTTERSANAAPLDALLVDAALGPVRRFVPDLSTAKWAISLARTPDVTARRLGELGAEAGRILTGTSTLAPSRGDRRFTDVAWAENPLLKRLVQLYLAGSQTAEQLLVDADLDPRDRKRVQFLLENVIQATAPSNVPLVNPASAKAAIDTAGLSLVRGGKQLAADLASAPRLPEMVDGSGFVLGENIAATPGGVVFRNEVLELIQYAPQTDEVYEVPALVVPPTINKYYALDLAPDRSLVEFGVRQGRQMFLISWRNPDARHASWNLDTYVRGVLDALDAVEEITGSTRTVLGGACSGGILASIAAALPRRCRAAGPAGRARPRGDGDRQRGRRDDGCPGRRAAGSPGQGQVGAHGVPRRPGPGRGVRVAAARRPGVELLGQQLPARQATARVRHPVLELRHHPDDRRTARRLRRPGDGELAHPARGPHRPRRPDRPRQDHRGLLHGRRHRRPHHAVGELLPQRPALRRHHPVRALDQRSHRRPGQPAGQPQGVLPHQPRPDVRRHGLARRLRLHQGSWWTDLGRWLDERCGAQRPAPASSGRTV